MSAPTPAPGDDRPREGYYPDPSIPGYVRYWNGAAWVPGTSRPAPSEGQTLPTPRGSAPAPATAEETGPVFLDEEPSVRTETGPDDAASPEPASAWAADTSHQTGFGGEQDRRVSWGAEATGGEAEQPETPAPEQPEAPVAERPDAPVAERSDAPAPGGSDAPASERSEGTVAIRAVRPGTTPRREGTLTIRAVPQQTPPENRPTDSTDPSAQAQAQAPGGAKAPGGAQPAGQVQAQAQGGAQPAGQAQAPVRAQTPAQAQAQGSAAGQAQAASQTPAPAQTPAGAHAQAPAPAQAQPQPPAPTRNSAQAQPPGQAQPPAQAPAPGYGYPPAAQATPQASAPAPGYGYPPAAQGTPTPAPAGNQPGYGYPPPSQSAPTPVPAYGYPQPAVPTPVTQGPGGGSPSWAQQVHQLATPQSAEAKGPVTPFKPVAEDPFLAAAQAQASARPAGLGKRFVARLIDSVVLLAVTAAAGVPLGMRAADHIDGKIDAAKASGRQVTVWLLDGTTATYLGIVLAVLLVFGVLYEALPTAKWGYTLGKKLMGLSVREIEGSDSPSFGAALRRWLVYCVPGVLGIGIIGVLWGAVDRPWRQCLHDKAARTFVAG